MIPAQFRRRFRSPVHLILSTFGSCMLSWMVLVAAASAAVAQPSQEELQHAKILSSAFEKVAVLITPSVVNINASKKAKKERRGKAAPDPFFEPFRDFLGDDLFPQQSPDGDSPPALGTGVIVDKEGHILTNNHVVGDADEVVVRLQDQRSVKAKIIGKDERSDLAVIKISAKDLVPASLGDSDSLKIGEWVVAAGNPFGLDNTITAGIVSAKGRSIIGGGQYEDFIQTDAAINPGNSGGPLVNLQGEVVGINTAIFSRSGGYMGIGFAIPMNMARSVMESLIKKGKVIRGWLGVGIQNLTDQAAQSFNYPSTEGALVGHVEPDGPAAKAGIKQGDIIVALNGNKVKNINQLRNTIAITTPGKSIDVDLIRQGRKQTISVKVEELPATNQERPQVEEDDDSVDIGASVETLNPDMAKRLGSDKREGVVVTRVRPGGLAASSGIQVRDIIVSVDGQEVKDVADFKKAITPESLKKGVRMIVESGGMERFVFLKMDE